MAILRIAQHHQSLNRKSRTSMIRLLETSGSGSVKYKTWVFFFLFPSYFGKSPWAACLWSVGVETKIMKHTSDVLRVCVLGITTCLIGEFEFRKYGTYGVYVVGVVISISPFNDKSLPPRSMIGYDSHFHTSLIFELAIYEFVVSSRQCSTGTGIKPFSLGLLLVPHKNSRLQN